MSLILIPAEGTNEGLSNCLKMQESVGALHWLKSWVEAQERFPECLRASDLEFCRQQRLTYLDSEHKPVVLGDEQAFLAWDTSALEPDTQSPVALLWANAGSLQEQAELLKKSAQELATLPLVISAFVQQDEWLGLLQTQGFYALRHFVTKTVKAQSLESPHSLRLGEENDRGFLTAVALSVANHTLPPHREAELGRYKRSLLKTLLRLDYGPESQYELMIAEDSQAESLAYLLLRTDSSKTAWVVDIGVDRAYWGKGLAQFLVLSAENLLWERGFEFYVGEISAANSRSYHVATELCGFSPNRQLWRRDASAPA